MAKQRYINTKFWRDAYIEELDPIEKLLFLYLLTNTDTNISGIYELPLKIIAVDTGIDKEMVKKLLIRFENDDKIKFNNGWVAIKNFTNHQTINSKIKTGITTELNKAPIEMKKWVNINENIGYIYPMYEVSDSNTNINSNNNYNINSNDENDTLKKDTTKTKNKTNKFIKPTIDELKAYISENKYTLDAEKFIDYYESKGWLVGKSNMKNWKATVRNWQRNQKEFAKSNTTSKANSCPIYTDDDDFIANKDDTDYSKFNGVF